MMTTSAQSVIVGVDFELFLGRQLGSGPKVTFEALYIFQGLGRCYESTIPGSQGDRAQKSTKEDKRRTNDRQSGLKQPRLGIRTER